MDVSGADILLSYSFALILKTNTDGKLRGDVTALNAFWRLAVPASLPLPAEVGIAGYWYAVREATKCA